MRILAVVLVLTAIVAGCTKVLSEHLDTIRALASMGDADMQQLLGDMYVQGHGVPQDYAEAVKWHRKAAEQGSVASQNNLGVAYMWGFGVPQDNVEAYAWLSVAADQGILGAASGREEAAKWMTNAEFERAQALAREYREKYVLPFRN